MMDKRNLLKLMVLALGGECALVRIWLPSWGPTNR